MLNVQRVCYVRHMCHKWTTFKNEKPDDDVHSVICRDTENQISYTLDLYNLCIQIVWNMRMYMVYVTIHRVYVRFSSLFGFGYRKYKLCMVVN